MAKMCVKYNCHEKKINEVLKNQKKIIKKNN